ncbi:hypothetical protein KCU93_g993, partial [Aureobasidium melanogenum]
MDSIKHSPYHNVLITGWHKPSFFGLVHLSYWHARFAQEFRRKGIRPLALGEIAHGFGNQFAVFYTIEQILDIGIQHMGSLNSIETLATRIFRYLHGHPLANNEWHDHGFDWATYQFTHVAPPVCNTFEERADRAAFCPQNAAKMFLTFMSPNFRQARSAFEAMLHDNPGETA